MPIKIPDNLPARRILEDEGVMVMSENQATRQDIRPMQIGLLNLMPNKSRTETQFARLVGSTPLQVELTLVKIGGHTPKNTSSEYMDSFYKPWEEVAERRFDGFIVTGAPIERLPFEDVTYWKALREIFDWTQTNVHTNFNICWGAQAALHHFYGVPKFELQTKAFGVFRHRNLNRSSPFLRGVSDDFSIPVSRWTEVRSADLPTDKGLEILMVSDQVGPCLIHDPATKSLHMFNHIEYDSNSLADEYFRDVKNGEKISAPLSYFPADNPENKPENRWRSHAHLLFGNWINQMYQTTPFDWTDL